MLSHKPGRRTLSTRELLARRCRVATRLGDVEHVLYVPEGLLGPVRACVEQGENAEDVLAENSAINAGLLAGVPPVVLGAEHWYGGLR